MSRDLAELVNDSTSFPLLFLFALMLFPVPQLQVQQMREDVSQTFFKESQKNVSIQASNMQNASSPL